MVLVPAPPGPQRQCCALRRAQVPITCPGSPSACEQCHGLGQPGCPSLGNAGVAAAGAHRPGVPQAPTPLPHLDEELDLGLLGHAGWWLLAEWWQWHRCPCGAAAPPSPHSSLGCTPNHAWPHGTAEAPCRGATTAPAWAPRPHPSRPQHPPWKVSSPGYGPGLYPAAQPSAAWAPSPGALPQQPLSLPGSTHFFISNVPTGTLGVVFREQCTGSFGASPPGLPCAQGCAQLRRCARGWWPRPCGGR